MEHIKVDVAVVAAGPAGLAASIAAAESGAKVAAFEKMGVVGGTGNMGMGPFGVESPIQKQMMVSLTKEEAFEKFMDYVHWQTDARIVRDYFWKSGDTIQWLMDMGVEFAGAVKFYPGSEATWHLVKPENGMPGPRGAGTMYKIMHKRAQELGVEFYFQTPVYELIKTDGKITGLKAKDNTGKEYEVEAKAVIVATGGFGNNDEMVKQYTGYTFGKDMFSYQIPGITGDGINMVWSVGGAKGRMDMEKMASVEIPMDSSYGVPFLFLQPTSLIVNSNGIRVCNEGICENSAITCNVIDRQKGRCAFAILSTTGIKHFKKDGMDYSNGVAQGDLTADLDEHMEELEKLYPGSLAIADSIEELADKLGINKENLLDTVEEYNDICEEKYDDVFGKNRKYLHAVHGKKYYAIKMVCGAYGSLGGIVVNNHFEVLDEEEKPIKGLYAAGTDTCDLYAGTYLYYLPGNTMGYAINSGRIAGENAAEFAEE